MDMIEQEQVSCMEDSGENLSRNIADKRHSWIQGAISPADARFLSGLIAHIEPEKVVEIGVASGWSSTVMLNTLSQIGTDKDNTWLTGVDLSPDYYIDRNINTGAAVNQIVPELSKHYETIFGKYSFQAMLEVGEIDFAFIDAHHAHPWATLDLIAVLPFLKPSAWVALHDLNLCTFPRHEHRNRAPFYLYYLWKGPKIHSTQKPTMIGAVQVPTIPLNCFDEILEVLANPWEIPIPETHLALWEKFVAEHVGKEQAEEFRKCCALANIHV